MLSIGDLARRARVSVRMLRHYDALGLITPQRVDEATGYRWYAPSQVGRVHSLVALKELGFTLAQCRQLLEEQVTVEQLHAMLQLRAAELQQRIDTDARRLQDVRRRLGSIERGLEMSEHALEIGPLPALRLAQVRVQVNDTTEISTVLPDVVRDLTVGLAGAGLTAIGPRVTTYHGRPDGSVIDVAAGVQVGPEPAAAARGAGLEVVEVPAEPLGATFGWSGPAADLPDVWTVLDAALDGRGLQAHGLYRQLDLSTGDDSSVRVVELQCAVRDVADCD